MGTGLVAINNKIKQVVKSFVFTIAHRTIKS